MKHHRIDTSGNESTVTGSGLYDLDGHGGGYSLHHVNGQPFVRFRLTGSDSASLHGERPFLVGAVVQLDHDGLVQLAHDLAAMATATAPDAASREDAAALVRHAAGLAAEVRQDGYPDGLMAELLAMPTAFETPDQAAQRAAAQRAAQRDHFAEAAKAEAAREAGRYHFGDEFKASAAHGPEAGQ